MASADIAGFLAGLFVILAFYCTDPAPLRSFAILSNVLFVIYAADHGLLPIAILHLVLLPLNIRRLGQALRLHRRPGAITGGGG